MEEIYLNKLDDPASLKISATKIKCSKRGKLYKQDMPRSLWCDAPNPERGQ